jgi:hypothetical protein
MLSNIEVYDIIVASLLEYVATSMDLELSSLTSSLYSTTNKYFLSTIRVENVVCNPRSKYFIAILSSLSLRHLTGIVARSILLLPAGSKIRASRLSSFTILCDISFNKIGPPAAPS